MDDFGFNIESLELTLSDDASPIDDAVEQLSSEPYSEKQPDQESDRHAQPVDQEQPPRLPFPVVGIGASAGGLEAFTEFFDVMPPDSGMAFILIQHLPPDRNSLIAEILSKHTKMTVRQVEDGLQVRPNHVYVIRPGHTLTIANGLLHLGENVDRPKNRRPIDDFFKSLAEEQRERAICIILSGMGSNGTAGAQAIKAVGGVCIAQDLESAQFPSMPRHLIESGYADYVLRTREIPDILISYSRQPYANERLDPEQVLRREQQYLREILALLRTRARHDFSGYKKPTVLRRIQRRMGLNRIAEISEYVKMLRQTPSEIMSLSDDLLIHVTGFFRDPESWESLRQKVIVPLVANREIGETVRCWVTACSSGEEAYSLAMLLVEECERANKPLDLKIFATDTAARTLLNARNGIYPGGIEAEISPSRLERFFERDDAIYRVRHDLREKVVFAPQNVLQDPPFSRLDIVTCRNFLIYLEPELQRRVLHLVHFGLRDGGALFLGSSETVPASDEIFESVDRKARIFRRIGPTRHGSIEFPMPRLPNAASLSGETDVRGIPRASLATLTTKALLARHVPASVTVDRDFRIHYYHGDTRPYLDQPTGEPTRDLLLLANENVRGAVRNGLHRALIENATVTILDGIVQGRDGRSRTIITVSPLEASSKPEYFVVSFDQRQEPFEEPRPAEPGADSHEMAELQRMRDELQNTIEELQTSNEEHKASSEEVMSINEELQSTNEELETSKEEMQSLNEELTTVNSQLQSKMEEYQAISNDLASLLSSTDIAVIFLDTTFRIRRYTPAAIKLLELISSDIGRPLNDLAKKFTDPDLLSDAHSVLKNLVPIQKVIRADDRRWFVRRILPYRTSDNRIDGVVITFVDTTDIRLAEAARQQSEQDLAEELRLMNKLQEVTNRLLGVPNLNEALTEILLAAMEIASTDMGILQLVDERTGRLNVQVQNGVRPEFPEDLQNAGSVFDDARRERRRIVVEDVKDLAPDCGVKQWAALADFQALQSTPLVTRNGEIIGILSTLFREKHQPLDRELRAMDLFVRQAADLIERIRTEEKLADLLRIEQNARQATSDAAQMRDQFLATLSHELRSPLSAILLWGKALRDIKMDSRRVREGIDAIIRNAEAQTRLIEDLVDTSRIASGKLRLEMEGISLRKVIEYAVDTIRPAADAKKLAVRVEVSESTGIVRCDPERMQQILWNLLTNAVKFTTVGGSVSIQCERKEDEIEIRVHDTGCGIDSSFLPLVFERFRQSDSSLTRKQSGLGLGLSISKELVELHGGTITVESDGKDKGTTFIMRFRMPALDVDRMAKQDGYRGKDRLRDIRILYVEDDSSLREIFTMILSREGAEVRAVENAAVALETLATANPAVLISDISLPEVDGYALIRQVRSFEAENDRPSVHAIAISAYARDTDREMAISSGYDRYFTKPVDPQVLIDYLSQLR